MRTTFKKALGVTVSLLMLLTIVSTGIVPVPAGAETATTASLPELPASGTVAAGKYVVSADRTVDGGVSPLTIEGDVAIYLPAGVTLTVLGGDAGWQPGGKAGINNENGRLYITGPGNLTAIGGYGGYGAGGSDGHEATLADSLGGHGGYGGGGGGAAIGGDGAVGGAGGEVSISGSGSGGSGGAGGNAHGAGPVALMHTLGAVTLTNGAAGRGGLSGRSPTGVWDMGGHLKTSGAGGGGGGAGGYGEAIGRGGAGGGGGGAGESGALMNGDDVRFSMKGGVGQGAQCADGTHAESGFDRQETPGNPDPDAPGGSGGAAGEPIELTQNADPTAYDALKGTVTLHDENGAADHTVDCYLGAAMTAVTPPERTGFIFLGYYTEDGVMYYNEDGSSAHVYDYDTLDLFALWSRMQYSVLFLGWDGQDLLKSENVYYEDDATPPEIPARAPDMDYHYIPGTWDNDYQNITSNTSLIAPYTAEAHVYGDEGSDRYTCGVCGFVSGARAADAQAADEAARLIGEIGEVTYTPEVQAKIDAARSYYDGLTDAQKAFVPIAALDTLTAAEGTYAAMQAATDAEALIAEIGEVTYTEECRERIEAAQDAVDALTPEALALVDEEALETLFKAEETYAKLKAKAENKSKFSPCELCGEIHDGFGWDMIVCTVHRIIYMVKTIYGWLTAAF